MKPVKEIRTRAAGPLLDKNHLMMKDTPRPKFEKMLKKSIAGLLIALFLWGGAFLRAQSRGGARKRDRDQDRAIQVFLNIGYINLFDHPRWMTLGSDVEVRLGKGLNLSPEVSLWFRDFIGHDISVVPGITLNLRLRNFTAGGGLIRRASTLAGESEGSIVPKFQAGYHSGPVKITGILILLLDDPPFLLGLSVGVRL